MNTAETFAAATLDPMARRIFMQAIETRRCGELLLHLFGGGGVTIDPVLGGMILIPAETIDQLTGETQ